MMYEGLLFMRRAHFTEMHMYLKINELHDVCAHRLDAETVAWCLMRQGRDRS
jgi:hypothetical protein